MLCLTSEYGVVTAVSDGAKDYGCVEEGQQRPAPAGNFVERCLQTRTNTRNKKQKHGEAHNA